MTRIGQSIGAVASLPRAGTRAMLSNFGHLLGGKAGAGLMSLVYLVVVAHRLGARDYGVLVLVNGYVLLVGGVVAFSGFHGLVRYGAAALQAGDRAALARLVRFMAVIELGCGLVAVIVAAVGARLVGPRLGWSPVAMELAVPYSLAVLATVRATPMGLLQIAERFDLIGANQLVSPALRLVGTLIVALAGGGLGAFLIVWLLSAIAEGVAMWLLALPSWRKLAGGERLLGPWRSVPVEQRGLVRFILLTNFDLTLRELAPNLVPLTVGWLLGPAAAGVLSLVQRTTQVLQQPAAMLAQASYAVLAGQAAARDHVLLHRTAWRGAGIALLSGAAIVALLGLGGARLIALLGGRSFLAPAGLLMLVALARMAGLATTPLAAALSALGRPQQPLAVGLLTSLGLYPLLPLLVGRFGLAGAGWHILLQALIGSLALAWLLARGRGRPA